MLSLLATYTDEITPLFLVKFLLILIQAAFSKIQVIFYWIKQLSPIKMKARNDNYEAMQEW
jgi:hypothetical protein